ncbi:TPA: hypothetical protein QCY05_002750 [Bacillus wiedmannii]|nr:hypothetical protein [Bacillus wiedmannii]
MAFKSEEELNKAFEGAKASLEIEGMTITKEMEKVSRKDNARTAYYTS